MSRITKQEQLQQIFVYLFIYLPEVEAYAVQKMHITMILIKTTIGLQCKKKILAITITFGM